LASADHALPSPCSGRTATISPARSASKPPGRQRGKARTGIALWTLPANRRIDPVARPTSICVNWKDDPMDNKAMAVLIAGLAILGLPHAAAAAGARPQTGPVAVTFGPDVQLSIDVPSQGKTADRVEPTIAVNPTDPRTLVAGYHLR